jgi:hypothetical protein
MVLARVMGPVATAVAAWVGVISLPKAALSAELLFPAYQYPTVGTMWNGLAAAASTVCLGVIMNPASGPGTTPDANYLTAIAAVRAHGGRIYGYVDTNYAARPSADVLADVVRYQTFYAVSDGIFLDQMGNDPNQLAYYRALTTAIHALMPGASVIANPGTTVPESFVASGAADVIVTYENNLTGAEPYSTSPPPAWTTAYPARRFSNIVYNVPDEATMRIVLATMLSRNVGVIFITHRTLPNPYDELPAYWTALVNAVAALPPLCAADMNGDGRVDLADMARFQPAFAGPDVPFAPGSALADCDDDGDVDLDDLAIVLRQFGGDPCAP